MWRELFLRRINTKFALHIVISLAALFHSRIMLALSILKYILSWQGSGTFHIQFSSGLFRCQRLQITYAKLNVNVFCFSRSFLVARFPFRYLFSICGPGLAVRELLACGIIHHQVAKLHNWIAMPETTMSFYNRKRLSYGFVGTTLHNLRIHYSSRHQGPTTWIILSTSSKPRILGRRSSLW